MIYIATDLGCDDLSFAVERVRKSISGRILFAVARILMTPEERSELKYPQVRLWWLEVDEASHLPIREIGFDSLGAPIVAAPIEEVCGLWVHAGRPLFNPGRFQKVAREDFEKTWSLLVHQWRDQHNPGAA